MCSMCLCVEKCPVVWSITCTSNDCPHLHVVNTTFGRKLAKDDGDSLLMTDKSVVPLARRRKDLFIELMRKTR
jgi:hypothetical protein